MSIEDRIADVLRREMSGLLKRAGIQHDLPERLAKAVVSELDLYERMNAAELEYANKRRAVSGAVIQCAHARQALKDYMNSPDIILPETHLDALRLRIEHPGKTLTELAELQNISKSAYWGRLRRAIENCKSRRLDTTSQLDALLSK